VEAIWIACRAHLLPVQGHRQLDPLFRRSTLAAYVILRPNASDVGSLIRKVLEEACLAETLVGFIDFKDGETALF
jgi:hypothetical protein